MLADTEHAHSYLYIPVLDGTQNIITFHPHALHTLLSISPPRVKIFTK
jgi:hypothetical protein